MAKTVDFQAKADSVFQTFDKIHQKSKELFDQEVQQAQKYSSSTKEQLRLLEEKARVLDRLAKQSSQSARDVASNFEVDKQRALKDIDSKIKEAQERRKAIRPGEAGTDPGNKNFLSAKKASTKEINDLIGEKNLISSVNLKDSPEYKALQEQERYAKLLYTSFRENLENTKTQGKDLAKAIVTGDDKVAEEIRGTAPNKNLVENISKNELDEKRKREKGSSDKTGFGDLIGPVELIKSLNGFLSTVSSFTNTKNGFDQIANTYKAGGEIIGTIAGGIIGAALAGPVGAMTGAGLGSQMSGIIGGTWGQLKQNQGIYGQELAGSLMKRRALTGQTGDLFSGGDMSNYGLNRTQFSSMQTEMARSIGRNVGVDKNTESSVYFEKGFGVQQSTSNTLVELLRSSKEGGRDLGNLLGGILKEGEKGVFKNGDRTFFNEFLSRNFSTMQRELLRSQNSVASGTTMDILQRFNSVGGPFEARDSRSLGLISTINSSLSNPGNDVNKALNFDILRKLHPEMGLEGILEEQQKGLSSSGFTKGVFDQVNQMGGDEGSKILNFAGRLGLGNNLAAARKLWGSRGFFSKNFSQSELSSPYSEDTLKKQASDNTTLLDKNAAGLYNEILRGSEEGAKKMYDAIKSALESVTIKIEKDGSARLVPGVKVNTTKTGSEQRKEVWDNAGISPAQQSTMEWKRVDHF